MSRKMKYDAKSVKERVLDNAGYAYYVLGRAESDNTHFEEELIGNAMFETLKKDTGSRKQFKKLLALSYMLQGIADNLRLLYDEPTELSKNEIEKLL